MTWKIIYLDRTPSTMIDAALHPPGTVVVAEEQTAGQGRLGRQWYSARGLGLYCSLVLAPPSQTDSPPVLTLALGLAAQEAIQRYAGISCDLRWPNDVLIGDRKCAGILVQLEGGKVIAGIGVNLNHRRFPPELAAVATSLRLATGREHSREDLLRHLLPAVDTYIKLVAEEGPDPILRLFSQASSYVYGRRVVAGALEGVTDGLDASGFLWLRTGRGRRRLIRAGNLRPA